MDENGLIIETGSHDLALLDPIMPSSRYLIRAYVVDSQGCHGESGNYTIVGMCMHLLKIFSYRQITYLQKQHPYNVLSLHRELL